MEEDVVWDYGQRVSRGSCGLVVLVVNAVAVLVVRGRWEAVPKRVIRGVDTVHENGP
jgi:hypothetical protein